MTTITVAIIFCKFVLPSAQLQSQLDMGAQTNMFVSVEAVTMSLYIPNNANKCTTKDHPSCLRQVFDL